MVVVVVVLDLLLLDFMEEVMLDLCFLSHLPSLQAVLLLGSREKAIGYSAIKVLTERRTLLVAFMTCLSCTALINFWSLQGQSSTEPFQVLLLVRNFVVSGYPQGTSAKTKASRWPDASFGFGKISRESKMMNSSLAWPRSDNIEKYALYETLFFYQGWAAHY